MKTADRILEILYDRGDTFVSLAELASAAGAGRRRVDAALQELGRRGHELEYAPAQGLRLVRPAGIDARLIERRLEGRRVGRSVLCFPAVGSTNDVAFDSARQGDTDGLVVLADSQHAGRGRQGRRWLSPPRTNLLMSVLLLDESQSLRHEPLTIAAGLAVAQGLDDACGIACRLKWPNDVLLGGAKLAGVLVEIRQTDGRRAVVVGVGINVNAAPPPGEVDRPATCVADCLFHPTERNEIAAAVLARLDDWLVAIGRDDLSSIHDEWIARCDMLNERLAVRWGDRRCEGRVLDVSPLEGLVLCDDQGRTVHIPAAGATVL